MVLGGGRRQEGRDREKKIKKEGKFFEAFVPF